MANKRMFSLKVVDDDAFLDLAVAARCLYYELSMRADDDGFLTPKKVIRMTGAKERDYDELVNAGYIIDFGSGVCCIRHWNANNNRLQGDRYKKTVYQEERSRLIVVDGRYEFKSSEDNPVNSLQDIELQDSENENPSTVCQQSVNTVDNNLSTDNSLSTVCHHSVNSLSTQNRIEEKRRENSTDSSLRSSSSPSRQNGPCDSGSGDDSSGLFLAEAPESADTADGKDLSDKAGNEGGAVFIEMPVFGKDRQGRDRTVPITESFVSQMEALYQACDVRQSIRNAVGWCIGNPKNRKKDWKRFLTTWLQRDNDRASPSARQRDGTGGGSRPRDWDGAYEGAAMTEVTI